MLDEDNEPSATASPDEEAKGIAENDLGEEQSEIENESQEDENEPKFYSEDEVEKRLKKATDKAAKNVTKRLRGQYENQMNDMRLSLQGVEQQLANLNPLRDVEPKSGADKHTDFKSQVRDELTNIIVEKRQQETAQSIQQRNDKVLQREAYLSDTVDDYTDIIEERIAPALKARQDLLDVALKQPNSPDLLYEIGKNYPDKFDEVSKLPPGQAEAAFWELLFEVKKAKASESTKRSSNARSIPISSDGSTLSGEVGDDDIYSKLLREHRAKLRR